MKKKLLLCMSAGLLLLLTACGIDLNTSFSADQNFKGTRVMDCSMNKSDYQDRDFDSLNQIVATYCPDAMQYENQSTDSEVHYVFTISFTSLDDYTQKIKTCLNFKPVIKYQSSNTPFTKGLIYQENFTSQDLMAWFSEAMVKEGFLSESEMDDIWNLNKTTFAFDSVSYETDNQIDIQTLTYFPLDQIHIYTSESKSGHYEQSIVFYLPKETMDKNGLEIQQYFTNDLNADHFRYEWDNYDNGKKCIISYEADTFSELNKLAKKVLKENISAKETITMNTDQVLSLHKYYSWDYSLDSYQLSSNDKLNYKFYYKPADSLSLEGLDDTQPDADGYYLITSGSSNTLSATIDVNKVQPVTSMQLTTIYKSRDNIQREAVISFESTMSNAEQKVFEQYLKDSNFTKTTYSSKDHSLFLMINGTPEQAVSAFDQFFESSNLIQIQMDTQSFSQSQKTTLIDVYDFSNILWKDQVDVTYYFISNAKESMKNGSLLLDHVEEPIEKLSALEKDSIRDSSDLTNFKGEYKYKITDGTSLAFTYQGGITDIYGSAAFLASILVIIAAFLILFLYMCRRRRTSKKS